jgi:hypothetical protein
MTMESARIMPTASPQAEIDGGIADRLALHRLCDFAVKEAQIARQVQAKDPARARRILQLLAKRIGEEG